VAKQRLWKQVTATVVQQRDYARGFRWLELEVAGDFHMPVAGQFVQLLLTPPSPVLLPRPMSIAGAMRKRARAGKPGPIVMGFLYSPVGVGTRAIAALEPGATVEVTGPLGMGYPLDAPGTPVLVAGGRGVAPLLMAADVLAAQGRKCEFVFGAREKELLIGLSEARERIAKAGGRLHLATDDGSRGFKGNVVQLLDTLRAKWGGAPHVIHACGPHGMLGAIARWGMRHGVPAHLAMESVMACGTGVCRGCPLPRSQSAREAVLALGADAAALKGNPEFAMCCTDGPVFEAHDLDWDRVE
jgi:dihydroorotate dehydrogenase electron transfer subunit